MALTVDRLIEILKEQPSGTLILIEDFNGSSSEFMREEDVTESWTREDSTGENIESVMMFTRYKEEK